MSAYLLSQFPLLIGLALLIVIASIRPDGNERLSHAVTVAALAFGAVLTALKLTPGEEFFGGAIRVTLTGKALSYAGLGFALVAVILAEDYLPKLRVRALEFRMVVLAQALGLSHLPLSGDIATLFIAFELVSIPSYVLAGFNHHDGRANEAGMKYLVLGAFGSVLFLFGLAFLYGATGALHLSDMGAAVSRLATQTGSPEWMLANTSLAFILGALLFKTGAAPFHFWLPDVYQGTNLASLAFLAVPAKVAAFGMLALMIWGPFGFLNESWKPYLVCIAACCALFGNLQALSQKNLKRLLAYSSVANTGFILLSLMAHTAWTFVFYLAAYGITVLGLIAAFMALGTRGADLDEISDLRGLGARHPWISGGLTLMLFSLAGIPLTAGFAAKFGVVSAAFKPGLSLPSGYIAAIALSVVAGVVSFFYYFKMVRALWLPREEGGADPEDLPRVKDWNAQFVLALCSFAVIILGILMRLPGMPIR